MANNVIWMRHRRGLIAQPHKATATGAIASFRTDVLSPLKVGCDITPVQDLNGQESPYPPGGGKNKCYADASHLFPRGDGLTIVENAGTFTAYAKVSKNTDIVFSCGTEPNRKIAFGFESEPAVGVVCNQLSYTVLSTTSYKFNSGNYEYVGFYYGTNTNTNIQIEEGSSATSFAPYSNICPITGWTECNVIRTGKNLFDVNALRAGTIDIPQSFPTGNVANADYIQLKPGEYTWSQIPYGVSGGRYVRFYNAKKELIDVVSIYTNTAYTFTVPDGTCYCKFMLYRSTNPFTSLDDVLALQPMVVPGSTESDYVPFNGNTYPISWQTEAGTVYGGTLDVTNGVLNVTTKLLDLGSVSWNKDDNRTGNFYTGNLSEVTNSGFAISCSDYKTNNSANANTISNGELSSYISYGAPRIFIKNTNYADYTGQQVTTALSGVKLVCTLATPITYTLTPTEITALFGHNHVLADTGDVSVEYWGH